VNGWKIGPDYFQVHDGDKWYTASKMEGGLWFVVNHQGRAIRQGTEIHRRVVAAVDEWLKEQAA
jgi:hypothetical protein